MRIKSNRFSTLLLYLMTGFMVGAGLLLNLVCVKSAVASALPPSPTVSQTPTPSATPTASSTPTPYIVVRVEESSAPSFPWKEVLLGALAPLSALAGIWFSQRLERQRERVKERQQWRRTRLQPYVDYFNSFLATGQRLELIKSLQLSASEDKKIRSRVGVAPEDIATLICQRPLKGDLAPFENQELREELDNLFELCDRWHLEQDIAKREELREEVGRKYRDWLLAAERYLDTL